MKKSGMQHKPVAGLGDAASRAIVSLKPSWRIAQGKNVTLHCEGPGISSSNQTRWFHGNASIQGQTSTFVITSATIKDSGNYRCQTGNSALSDPTYLGIYSASSKSPQDALSKSILSMNPSWRIFRGENVTLRCEGFATSGSNQTQWLHNGSSISVQSPTYDITFATINESGEYRCQTGISAFSDPVYLGIYSDWLLLQPSLAIIEEGEPLVLSCHGWKNRTVYKVTFYHNNKALKYWYENHKVYIPYATVQNRGYYYCTGFLWRVSYSSKPLYIDFKGFSLRADKGIRLIQDTSQLG
ncbi:high affinity immunoglobulin epsilon receptor subunit alpha, partial [Gracilinanus agilis]|uniref:high affinity immunoglobulin epsilon receptor subunit alpha n=1 Tax=Gracilinanus agilis TaxID=191870 RepID=UPI001CFDBB1B